MPRSVVDTPLGRLLHAERAPRHKLGRPPLRGSPLVLDLVDVSRTLVIRKEHRAGLRPTEARR